jgi:hypothetical protein
MTIVNSHTHCQIVPGHAKTKAWQKVCLPESSLELTENRANEEEA